MSDTPRTVLVANRGEIALRVFRAAQTLGMTTVGVHSQDDVHAPHTRRCDQLVPLSGTGPSAYLDPTAIVRAAHDTGAHAVHPGYGFLSESPELAESCREAGLTFIGPDSETLRRFGNKAQARALAREYGIPVLPGTEGPTTLEQIRAFVDAQTHPGCPPPAVAIKALTGGGGRGVRVVTTPERLAHAVDEARAEAEAAFGTDELYVEQVLPRARHVEVQVVGDGTGAASHLWDRDCSVQRRSQKLIEVAPSTVLPAPARTRMLTAAVRLASGVRLCGVATVEFLALPDGSFHFLEVNPRLQVEHTVTEQILGLDLVSAQLQLAAGAGLAEVGLSQQQIGEPAGCAIQIRVNAESADATGTIHPASGTLTRFEPATGAGIRVDAAAHTGMRLNPRFDSLLAKIVVHDRHGHTNAHRLARQALAETHIDGVDTNLAFQSVVLDSVELGACDTSWVDRNSTQLWEHAGTIQRRGLEHPNGSAEPSSPASPGPHRTEPSSATSAPQDQDGERQFQRAPTAGAVASIEVSPGQTVATGTVLALVEAMKMQHPLPATCAGRVAEILVHQGAVVDQGTPVVVLDGHSNNEDIDDATADDVDPDHVRTDLANLRERKAKIHDDSRPEAVAKRHTRGMRTARENIADLTDGGLMVEYGGLAVAAQRTRREPADLEERTPADGIVTGLGRVNGAQFPPERATCAILAYDYTVLAGTQGYYSHAKTDRILGVARDRRHPVVLFAEGGGGRPGDTDAPLVGGLNYATFTRMGALSGVVPTVGIAAGRCFAGNAALLGTCDVVIATQDATIGMAGPAMIEAGGLGTFTADHIGPIDTQTRNGVVDVAVTDEAEAVATAKTYLAYFQGPLTEYETPDQRRLRHVVPENRKRSYAIDTVLEVLFDTDSVLELRAGFGRCVRTALARIEGNPVGVIANDPAVLGGAIDADGADKMARFLQLCDTFALPVVSLCDTPGFMVGPEVEETATVRHFSRLFVRGGHLSVPMVTVVLRKAYGLGAMAMACGGFHNTVLTLAWPTGEFGGMGLEGAVRLAFRDELARIEDPEERRQAFDTMVAHAYEQGSAVNTAAHLEIDEVIDPEQTRGAITAALLGPGGPPRAGWVNSRRGAGVDTW
ncbi:carboxyl transferase domain-containing protein [Lipingzhangella sp. LS1_29]|uniref:Carboxyl transferase domain-containing protein n=1 Tax=Lipingzhangella rawalii TaxID=2055835 RepID=A0ABU2H5X3_9ACTN|nr:carboxyl transferase domain-containing protein [Lipingzhangella rawalii]MDS1270702.1 carboxyl transferase domain-containing protein [Lipingzhangella rawalii]